MTYVSLPPAVQTAYLDLLAAVMVAPLPGRGINFITRTSRGRKYWYLQYVIGESKQSFYLGPDNATLRERVDAAKALYAKDMPDVERRERLVATVAGGGLHVPSAAEARVYEALAQAGVFAGGGVLVGSHAFVNIGNLLGVRWNGGIASTADIDVARDPSFEVAMPDESTNLEAILRETHKAFFAVPTLNPKHPSTRYRIRGQELSVSLLTPMRGQDDATPIPLPTLSAAAEPVRFLDYVMTDTQLAAIPARAGILVHVPDPARFALHKLVISQRRPSAFATKSRKDIAQADAVLEVLRNLRPGDVRNAAVAARDMGGKFMQQMREGAERMGEANAEFLLPLLEE